jgi:hypothetical protein
MARTGPDFGKSAPQQNVTVLADMGELAARLLSPVMFNRSGIVFWIDDFEKTNLHWSKTTNGVGSDAVVSETSAYMGSQSCYMTAGAAANNFSKIYRFHPYPLKEKTGWSFMFSPEDEAKTIDCYLESGDGTNEYRAHIRINLAEKTIQLRDENGDFQTIIEDLKCYRAPFCFHLFKLIVDLENGTYLKFIYDETEYDISDYGLYPVTLEGDKLLYTAILFYGTQEDVGKLYIDNVILTQNEI